MSRKNWERLVRATLKRELGQGHERMSSGIAWELCQLRLAVRPILTRFCSDADEIQNVDPNDARISSIYWSFTRAIRDVRVADIQREEQKFRESGTTANLGEFELRSPEVKKVFATLRTLVYVKEALSKDADPQGAGRHIMEELQRIKTVGELTSYNIVPLEAPSLSNAIGVFPEVRGAMSAIRYAEHYPRLPADFVISGEL
ncbi:LOW QUALITY PROTEIN: hypothetical protein NC651_034552 [Populus alba x Populus x berolinensis]|nr:LOW QUALITY PROTEIN: hypothetical protein NC651_034552 [Populus alba x Populus x berolinensis]